MFERSGTRVPAGAPPGTVAVLAVDDQAIFRRVACELVGATAGFALVGVAESGPEALALAAERHPDLALVDMRMPGMDGIETARRLAIAHPATVIVLITLDALPDLPSAAHAPCIAAHVRKQDLSPDTLRALWAAHGPKRGG
jgi:two-component system, NarL family, invasion response regulator UvrY